MDSFSITEPLVAKGTSLLVMIPGALSATIGNLARKNIHWKVALTVGLTAILTASLGVYLAENISPFWANVALSHFLLILCVQLLLRKIRPVM